MLKQYIVILFFIILIFTLLIYTFVNYINMSECGFGIYKNIYKIIYIILIYITIFSIILFIKLLYTADYNITYYIRICGAIMLFLSVVLALFYLGSYKNNLIHVFHGTNIPLDTFGIDGNIYVDDSDNIIDIDNLKSDDIKSNKIYTKINSVWKNINFIGEGDPNTCVTPNICGNIIEAQNDDIFLDKNRLLCYIKIKKNPWLFGNVEDKWLPIFQEGNDINKINDQNKVFYNTEEKAVYNKINGYWFKNSYEYQSSCKDITFLLLLFILSIIFIFNSQIILLFLTILFKQY